MSFLNKPYSEMTDDELVGAHTYWSGCVEEASGWASAHEAAKQLKNTVNEGNRRGLKMVNPYPIIKG